MADLLIDGGFLLASPFYVTRKVPKRLVNRARKVFGITITTEPRSEIMWMYRSFEILYQEDRPIEQETPRELDHYCESTIAFFQERRPDLPESVYRAAYDRLLQVKEMSNALRPYQRYIVLVLRYRRQLFGRRLVELF